MEFAAPLIFLSIFVFASISLFLVYKYGYKKKSFEEALAEHRKQTRPLLGPKLKLKEKKNKKAAKKINKEKGNTDVGPESNNLDGTESVDVKGIPEATEVPKILPQATTDTPKGSHKQNKTHVEFKEGPEEIQLEVSAEKEIKDIINKKTEIQKPPISKEEKKHEKHSKKNKVAQKQDTQRLVKNGVSTDPVQATREKEDTKEEKIIENTVTVPLQETIFNAGKEKKKKKSEFNSRQQLTAERDQLIHSIRNAELSRTEVQMLIDLLLNKQLEAPTVIDDWTEGKSDPVQKLKKQLAEREKQLADEQDALTALQGKLKEIRNEQLSERAQLQQKFKAAEESKVEIAASHARLQQKIQELEEFRNNDLANFQRVVEENKALQMQRAQMEASLISYQETDALIHNLKAENAHLNNELQLLTQERQEQVRATTEYVKNLERTHGFALGAQQEESRNLAEQLRTTSDSYLREEQKLKDMINQLKSEKQKLQEENNVHVNGSIEDSKEQEIKILNLTNELTFVKSELKTINQTFLETERQFKIDLSSSQEQYAQLKKELDEQKNKNNELRKKNWKVMEALNAAENRHKSSNKGSDINVDQLTSKIKLREQNAQKEFIQRLFPEIDSLKNVASDEWQEEYEILIQQHISQLIQDSSISRPSSSEVAKLRSEIQHYKKIIDETDGVLKQVESRIELEERKWRNKLIQKDAEIQELKNHCVSQEAQLQVKVTTLEIQLEREREEKQKILEERQLLVNRPEIKSVHSDATTTVEKLSEEVDRLREQLRIEQTKNSESSVYQNGETS